jgi:hypothetical protein
MQPTELVAVMAAIIYSGRRSGGGKKAADAMAKAQGEAVIEAWQLWHLTLEQWTDFGERQFQDPNLHP